jgi:predicted  nucleic acid-binding Zn-ribbon protein
LDLDESQIYEEYDVAGKTQVIKDRNVRNQKSMQMAKLKGDKTGEKMYQLKLQIDQIDLQKAKLKGEVSKIQDERKAQRDKIKSLGE